MKNYYTYLLASKRNGTLYVGVTSNLEQRMYQHKHKVFPGFTKKYGVDKLVWYAETTDVNAAIYKEKQMKKWKRQYKLNLIEEDNPEWQDLAAEWFPACTGMTKEKQI